MTQQNTDERQARAAEQLVRSVDKLTRETRRIADALESKEPPAEAEPAPDVDPVLENARRPWGGPYGSFPPPYGS